MTKTGDTMTIYLLLFCVSGALASSSPILRCRKCMKARSLDDCTAVVNCDASTEDCYMDESVTDQLTIEYIGGCRAKSVCQSSISGTGKRQSLIACSRCCNNSDGCNERICGITRSQPQCQYCDVMNGFANVTDPTQCTTLVNCQSDEMCIASDTISHGRIIHTYGCKNSMMCKLLMVRSLQHYKICTSKTATPPAGYTVDEYCGSVHLIGRRSASHCQVCCGDSLCNHGTCTEITARLAALEEQGKLDMNTLKEKI